MASEPNPPKLEIYSNGCAERYIGLKRGEARACDCPERKCWVTYARNQVDRELPVLGFEEWKEGLA